MDDPDFTGEDMMPISWEKCPSCRWPHHPERQCPPYPSPDEEKETKMADDWTSIANSAVASMNKNKKKKSRKLKKAKAEVNRVNPVNVETRFGVLPPWGGAMSGGASIRFRDDDTEKN